MLFDEGWYLKLYLNKAVISPTIKIDKAGTWIEELYGWYKRNVFVELHYADNDDFDHEDILF